MAVAIGPAVAAAASDNYSVKKTESGLPNAATQCWQPNCASRRSQLLSSRSEHMKGSKERLFVRRHN